MNEIERRLDVALRTLRETSIPFWVAGGLAIDLFLGENTRAHDDIDIQIIRGDEHVIAAHLVGWDLHSAHDGVLEPWRSDRERPSRDEGDDAPRRCNSIWCRESVDAPWAFELLVADVADGQWLYRRDHRIMRSLDKIGGRTATGVPFVRPEVQLLFKSKRVRSKDEADFRAAVPRMDADARTWLAGALERVDPAHVWLSALSSKR